MLSLVINCWFISTIQRPCITVNWNVVPHQDHKICTCQNWKWRWGFPPNSFPGVVHSEFVSEGEIVNQTVSESSSTSETQFEMKDQILGQIPEFFTMALNQCTMLYKRRTHWPNFILHRCIKPHILQETSSCFPYSVNI